MEAKTVKVRVAVAVDPTGAWCAAGWNGCDDEKAMSSAVDLIESGEARYWLTAELPLPTTPEVAAGVEEAL